MDTENKVGSYYGRDIVKLPCASGFKVGAEGLTDLGDGPFGFGDTLPEAIDDLTMRLRP